MLEVKNKIIIWPVAVLVALVSVLFVMPNKAEAALSLPQTPCDDELVDAIIPGFGSSAHITSNMELENGETAFNYGSDNNSFITTSGNLITLHPNLLFDPVSNVGSVIKLHAFNATCTVVLGFGVISGSDGDAPLQDGPNTVSYNTTNNEVVFNNGLTHMPRASGIIRYIWLEAWDGKTTSDKLATYSYLIDVQNPQNPTGSAEEPPPPEEPSGKRPVLIVPGITGTALLNSSDELIWPNISRMFNDINDQFLTDNLGLDENGNSIQNIRIGEIIRDISIVVPEAGINKTILDSFSSLFNGITSKGYSINNSLFFFPYDWRLDLDQTKHNLEQKIDEIKTQTGFQKVDVIAHSMGGLLVEDYLTTYGKDEINKLIFVGTPHLGAPKAAKILLYGDHMSIPWLEEDRIREIAQNSPAVYQLLPSPDYFNNFMGYIAPYHIFKKNLYDYAETQNHLIDKGVNTTLLSASNQFFDKQLYNQDFSGIEVYNIAGCRTATQTAYRYGISNNSIAGIGYSSGDGTVPLVSADYVNIPSSNKYYLKNGSHAELPSNSSVRELILDILSDNISTYDNLSQSRDFCKFKGKKLTWRSPVDVHIYDQNGNHSGPIEGGFENNIPGVDYEILDGEKFLFLPTDEGQIFNIEAFGQSLGTFDLLVSEIENEDVLKTTVFNDIDITEFSEINLQISENSPDDSLVFDFEGDGIFNILNSDVVLNGDVDQDNEPPMILIKFNPETQDYEFSAVDVVDPDPTILCSETECTATDQTGNNYTINFRKLLNRNVSIMNLLKPVKTTWISSIKYRRNEIQKLKQTLTSKEIVATVDYKGNRDKTTVNIQEKGKRGTRETYQGLKLLQLLIKQDMLNVEIK